MKKFATLMSTVIAAVSFAGVAHADDVIFDGYGSIAAGYHALSQQSGSYVYNGNQYNNNNNNDSSKMSGLDVNARVSVSAPLGGHFGAQVDGDFDHVVSSFPSNYSRPAFKSDGNTLALHTFMRNSKGLIGVFGQRNGASNNIGYYGAVTTYAIGGEAQAYLGKVTLYGQVAYNGADSVSGNNGYGVTGTGPAVAVQMHYFPMPNWALTVKTGYQFSASNQNYSDRNYFRYDRQTYSGLMVGARSEYRLPHSHASLFLDGQFRSILLKEAYNEYNNANNNNNYNYSYAYSNRANLHDVRLMAGAKLNFGAHTLIERDRSGASLDPITPMFDGIAVQAGRYEY